MLMHIDFIKINKSMHNYSYVVVLVLRLTGQFLLIYIFLYKRYFKCKKHKQKHLSNIQLNTFKSKKNIKVTSNIIFLKANKSI